MAFFADEVEGPLALATEGGVRILPMPIGPGSTYESLHKLMDAAYIAANPHGDADPWLDLGGLESAQWGHHSLRRLTDTCARKTMATTGASEMDIDLMFGWQERIFTRNECSIITRRVSLVRTDTA